jgi:hypothetical protein
MSYLVKPITDQMGEDGLPLAPRPYLNGRLGE